MSGFTLRKKKRVSYCETEEPGLDEYIFCSDCGDYVYEYCSIHGPLLVIPDTKVPSQINLLYVPRAALTIPNVFLHLAPSTIPGAGLGVFTTLTLPNNVRFGPYRGIVTQESNSDYCWQIYDKNNRPSHVVDASDANSANWMRYVNCSRHWSEQNLVAYQYRGQLYYRTIKIIPRFTELMIFYGSEFANKLCVDIRRYNKTSALASPVGSLRNFKIENDINKENKNKENNFNKNVNVIENVTQMKSCKKKKSSKQKIKEKGSKSKKNILNKENLKGILSVDKVIHEKNSAFDVNSNKLALKTSINEVKIDINKRDSKEMIKHTPVELSDIEIARSDPKYTKELNISTILYTKSNIKLPTDNNNNNNPLGIISFNVFDQTVTKDIDKKQSCDICSHKCVSKSQLVLHKRTHTGEKPFSCDICSYKCARKGDLDTHKRTHTGEKPFSCDICSYKCARKSHLVSHKKTHTGEKPFSCDICSYKCARKGDLGTHKRTHTGEKPFSCDICSYKCTKRSALLSHKSQHM